MKILDIISEDNKCEAKKAGARKIFKLFNKGTFIANDGEAKFEYEFIGNENNLDIICFGPHNKIEVLVKADDAEPFPFNVKVDGEVINPSSYTFGTKETLLTKISYDIRKKLKHFKIMVTPIMSKY